MLQTTDAEQAAAVLTYTVTTAPTHGTLYKSGVSTSSFTQADINSGSISYTHDGSETTSDSFVFSVADGLGGSVTAQTFSITITAVNDAPVMSDITNKSTDEDVATGAIAFIVGDAETLAANLMVTATSNNQTLLPDANIVIGGAGANRTINLTPAANKNGSVVITVKVKDENNLESTDTFTLTINAVNDAPTLTSINTLTGAEKNAAFTITYEALAEAADEADIDTATISFRVETVESGTLKKGGVAVVEGTTTLSAGESLVWTPATNGDVVAAFTVKAYDGAALSATAVTATVDVANEKAVLPTANPLSGAIVKKAASITLSSEAGATIYYTTDGNSPTALSSSITSGNTITVDGDYGQTITVKAYAAIAGKEGSNIVTFTYTIQAKKALTITGLSADNKVYDSEKTATLSGTATLNGIEGGDTVTISGTPAATFSDKNVADNKVVTVTGYTLSGDDAQYYTLTQPSLTANITTRSINIHAITIVDKVYNGNTAGNVYSINADGWQSSVAEGGDDISIDYPNIVVTFANANVGNGKNVTVSNIGLSGAESGNYSIVNTFDTTGNITAKPITVISVTVTNKVYNGNANATIEAVAFDGKVGTENVAIDFSAVSASFDDANIGNNKTVTLSGAFALSGTAIANYSLNATVPVVTANITAKELTISAISVDDKVYNSNTTAAITNVTLNGLVDINDDVTVDTTNVTANFNNKNVGNNKAVSISGVFGLSGTDIANYSLSSTLPAITADITARPLTIDSITIEEKIYDGTTTATITAIGLSALADANDVVAADFSSAVANFANAGIGNAKEVIISGSITLNGADAGNYSLSATLPNIIGNIIPEGTVLTPVASVSSGVVAAGTTVTLSCATTGASIYYTTDGTAPTSSSTLYNTEITVNPPMVIKAIAVKAGWTDSAVMTETYSKRSSSNNTNSGAEVIVNGETQNAGTADSSTTDGKTVTTITVDDTKLEKVLEAQGSNATVTIPVNSGADVAVGVLTGQMIKNMETKEAVLQVQTGSITYTLPAAEINIDAVSAQIGETVALKDIKVNISVASPSADTVKIVEDTANKNSYQVVVKPVEFEITCTSGNKTVDVSKFNGYVERTVAIPDGIDPSKITTGIVLNADGTFSHVPTTIVKVDGKYYAKINSLTNSTYSVIYNEVAFSDVASHWAKASVNNMGSRLVVSGVGNNNYNPNSDITRAEFAAIIVRALGLQAGTGKTEFTDVNAAKWYAGYVKTAFEYGIITGYSDGTFGANNKITREQAMAMIARAMKLTGISTTLTNAEISTLLGGYTDGAQVAAYAKIGIANCLEADVVTGRTDTTLAPKGYITRAEVGVIVERLLEKSALI